MLIERYQWFQILVGLPWVWVVILCLGLGLFMWIGLCSRWTISQPMFLRLFENGILEEVGMCMRWIKNLWLIQLLLLAGLGALLQSCLFNRERKLRLWILRPRLLVWNFLLFLSWCWPIRVGELLCLLQRRRRKKWMKGLRSLLNRESIAYQQSRSRVFDFFIRVLLMLIWLGLMVRKEMFTLVETFFDSFTGADYYDVILLNILMNIVSNKKMVGVDKMISILRRNNLCKKIIIK